MRSDLIQISCSIDEVTKDQIRELSQLSLQSVDDRYATQHQPPDCPLVLCPLTSLHVWRERGWRSGRKQVSTSLLLSADCKDAEWKPEKVLQEIQLKYSFVLFNVSLGQLVEKNAELITRCSLDFSKFCNRRYVSHMFKAVSKNLTEAVVNILFYWQWDKK